jgi:hypothetical protein
MLALGLAGVVFRRRAERVPRELREPGPRFLAAIAIITSSNGANFNPRKSPKSTKLFPQKSRHEKENHVLQK